MGAKIPKHRHHRRACARVGAQNSKDGPASTCPALANGLDGSKDAKRCLGLRMFRVATLAPETRPETRERPMLGSRIPQPAAAIVPPEADDLRTDHLGSHSSTASNHSCARARSTPLIRSPTGTGETCFRSLEQLERSFTDAQFARECAFVLQSPLCGSITLFPEGGQAFVPSPCGNRPTA